MPGTTSLKTRPLPSKTMQTFFKDQVHAPFLIVKFREGLKIQTKSNQVFDIAAKTLVQPLEQLAKQFPALQIERLFKRRDDVLLKEKASAETLTGVEQADPTLFHCLSLANADTKDLAAIADQLNRSELVEIAYLAPMPYPAAAADIAPATPDFSSGETHLGPAPLGIDVNFARQFTGGRGEGSSIIDVEGGWNLDHEDLPDVFFDASGIDAFFTAVGIRPDWKQHGTAVLGILAAAENQYGVTGIAPAAEIGVATALRLGTVAAAIDEAASHLRPGDVILIEVHYPGPHSDFNLDVLQNQQNGFVPVEHSPADFDAIRRATAQGIIVVEAAGNGGENLDDTGTYGLTFARGIHDSGAIMVGASDPATVSPLGFSNFGTRVDVNAWGAGVKTCGYGDSGAWSRVSGDDQRQWYTGAFSGTSSASPMVAGAVLTLQGILRANGRPLLTPRTARELLMRTGTSQMVGSESRLIGKRPNLRAAITHLGIPLPAPVSWPSLGFSLGAAPATGVHRDGRMEIFCVGIDGRLWQLWQTAPSNSWSSWRRMDADHPQDVRFQGRPAVVLNNDGRMEVFVRDTANHMWHIWQTAPDAGWSGLESLGGECASDAAVGINDNGRLEAFVRWSSGELRHIYQRVTGALWSGWESLGGGIHGKPAVVRSADLRLEVFARGSDDSVWHIWQVSPGGSWSSWAPLGGGILSGDPVATANVDGRMEVFGRGLDGALWHVQQTAPRGGWSDWQSLGGSLAADSSVCVDINASNGLEVFARWAIGGVRHISEQGLTWSGWDDLGGNVTSDPAAGHNLDRRLEVFARGSDNSLVHRWETSAFGPWNRI